MNAVSTPCRLRTGDVIEIDTHDGDAVPALVLLASNEAVIYDLLDGSMPLVAKPADMPSARVFQPA
jgi:magnesium-transporting ATPase (P-type)